MIDRMVHAYSAMVPGVTGLMDFRLTLSSNMDRHTYKRFDATPSGKGLVIATKLLGCLILMLIGISLCS